MAGLNAFGFQVRKSSCETVPWSKNDIDITKEQQNLPWHLPLKSSPSKGIPSQTKKNAQSPSIILQKQHQKEEETRPILLKSKCTDSSKKNTITRYFQKAPRVIVTSTSVSLETHADKDDGPEYCVVKHKIPFSELWTNIVEDLQSSCLIDSAYDDDLQKMLVLSIPSPRGRRRKIRDGEEDGDCRRTRNLGRTKMVKLDLVSAFQSLLTVSPTVHNLQMMDFECENSEDDDADECLERPVKHRMSVAEAALLFQHIADELLMY